jgi:quercetin dioxygenase-like cupin family protein
MFGSKSVYTSSFAAIVGLSAIGAALIAVGFDDSGPRAAKAEGYPPQPPVTGSLITMSPDDPKLTWAPCPEIFPKGCEVTVLSGDPAKGPSDVYLRAPAGTDLKKHWHTSAEHVVLLRGKFSVTFEDGRKASVDQGAYTLIPGGMPHSARCEGPEDCLYFIGFEKPVDAVPATMADAK